MSATAWPENSLTDFYQRQLLPTAFERLDQLDPSSAWRAADFGWRGVSGERARTCFQPWGFVDAAGGAHSWLASFSGRLPASAGEFLEAVDRLAQLLGLEDSLDVQRVPPYDLFAAYLQFRQDSLFETFLGLAQHQLGASAGANARAALADRFGVDDSDVAAWPLGIYPEPQELFARLRSAGFSSDEIGWSAVLGDQRLPGRLLVPWRDRWGRLSTVVARDWQSPATAPGRQLLLPAGTRSQIFGLDVALRAEASHGHIYVAEGLLEVVALQARGVRNVCSAGRLGAPLTADFWQELTAAAVREATLLLRSGAGRGAREVAAVEAAAGLLPAPVTWVHCGRGETAKELASSQGVANVLAKRHAGFTVVAQRIVERHSDLERQDTQLALLSEAVAFDELVRDPERQADLERQFWPVIEQALGGGWPALRASRTVATGSLEQRQDCAARVRLYARLLTDLHILLAGRDVLGFERRLREILGPEHPQAAQEPAPQPALAPSLGTWELIELKPVSTVPPRPVEVHRVDWLDPLPAPPPRVESPKRPEPPSPEPVGKTVFPPLTTSSPPAPRVPRIMPRAVNPDDVRLRAYCLWEKHGRPDGREVYFWAMAERELRGEASATLASPPASH